MKKSIIILAVMLVAALGTQAQDLIEYALMSQQNSSTASATATGSATANIVIPLEITKNVDLAFGNIAAGPSTGVVTIATDGTRSGVGGVTLIAAGNVSNSAQFSLTGYPSATFAIALPGSITIANGGYQMTVDGFVSSLGMTSTLDFNGQAALNVGANLNVNADQEPGLYTGSFDITVAYN